jgi:hypothetical protein
MIRVYTADNTTQAHLIADVLEKHGIPASVSGSDSLHGIGQPITVWIKDSHDEARAKEILGEHIDRDGETTREDDTRAAGRKAANSQFFLGLIAGLLLGLLISHYYPALKTQAELPAGIDRNSDGRVDTWYEYVGQEVVKDSRDQNYDGRADTWHYYDKGVPVRGEADRNHDSTPEEWAEYNTSGDLAETHYDMNFDGKPDHWEQYSNGVPTSYASDNNRDGTADEWGQIENGQVTERKWSFHGDSTWDKIAKYREGRRYKESYDRNRDGILEEVVTYDEYERVIAEEKKQP